MRCGNERKEGREARGRVGKRERDGIGGQEGVKGFKTLCTKRPMVKMFG